jgi:hypothetical protein
VEIQPHKFPAILTFANRVKSLNEKHIRFSRSRAIGRPDSGGIQAIVVSNSSVTAIVGLKHTTAQRMKSSYLVSSESTTKSIWNRVSTTLA